MQEPDFELERIKRRLSDIETVIKGIAAVTAVAVSASVAMICFETMRLWLHWSPRAIIEILFPIILLGGLYVHARLMRWPT